MRYLRQFSEWRDRQTAAVEEKTAQLKTQRDQNFSLVKKEQDRMLIQQKSEQAVLQNQYGKQDALVAQLKANGQASTGASEQETGRGKRIAQQNRGIDCRGAEKGRGGA